MTSGVPQRVATTAVGRASGATTVFACGGQLRVVAVVKASFAMVQGRAMTPVDPEPIIVADAFREGDPTKSVIGASDLAPYRPRADVLLRGHAHAPGGQPVAKSTARLRVARGQKILVDKRVTLQGSPGSRGPADGPLPFTKLPLVYELAARAAENPVGAGNLAGTWPSICDAWSRPVPVGFGPINPRWPQRRALLGDPTCVDREQLDLPADFPWAYFQAAPEDQRMEFLHGDEWIGMEGIRPTEIQSQLPSARGVARVYGPDAALSSGQPIALTADTLSIDADHERVSVVWRGSFPVARNTDLSTLHVLVGVELADVPVVFPAKLEQIVAARSPSTRPQAPITGPELPAVRHVDRSPPQTVKPRHARVQMSLSAAPPSVALDPPPALTAPASPARKRQTMIGSAMPSAPAMPFAETRPPSKSQTMPAVGGGNGRDVPSAVPFTQARPSKSQTIMAVRPPAGAPATPFEAKVAANAPQEQTPPPQRPPLPPSSRRGARSPQNAARSKSLGQTMSLDLIHQAAAHVRAASAIPFSPTPPPFPASAAPPEPTARSLHETAPASQPPDTLSPASTPPETRPGAGLRNASPLPFVAVRPPEPAPPERRPPSVAPPPVVPPSVFPPATFAPPEPRIVAPPVEMRSPVPPPPMLAVPLVADAAKATSLGAHFLAAMARATRSTQTTLAR